jgi:hypothetical protein
MERYWVILKGGYVIDKVIWDGETNWTYPFSHDSIIEDIENNVSIGDWWEEEEGIFYRPLSIPPDYPNELIPTENEE